MRRYVSAWTVLGTLFLTAALALAGYNLACDRLAEEASERTLEQLDNGAIEGENVPTSVASSRDFPSDVPLPVKKVDDNFYVGTLRIPSLGLELPVMEEWSYEGLRVAPCRYAGSAYAGDMVIAAHSYTSHFGRLSSISYGDEVSFADVCGNVFVYKVVSVEELQSTDVGAMVQSEWELTLFTCTFDGSARVAVRCDEIVF